MINVEHLLYMPTVDSVGRQVGAWHSNLKTPSSQLRFVTRMLMQYFSNQQNMTKFAVPFSSAQASSAFYLFVYCCSGCLTNSHFIVIIYFVIVICNT